MSCVYFVYVFDKNITDDGVNYIRLVALACMTRVCTDEWFGVFHRSVFTAIAEQQN